MSAEPLGSRYVLDQQIGQGGMGVVWRGRDRTSGAVVAIKVLRPELAGNGTVVSRFVQERTVLTQIRHHNIVAVHDMIVEGDRLALVMDLVSGRDLHGHREQAGGTLTPAEATWLTAQMCDALGTAHASGIVHRDIKPANVLLEYGDRDSPVRLADFGIARITQSTGLTSTDVVIGTAAYLAPEIITGRQPEPSTDIYAVGITLYELLTGRPPFPVGHPAAVIHHHLNTVAPRLPGIPDVLWPLIEACLAKDPGTRPTAPWLAQALRAAGPALAGLPAGPVAAEAVIEWQPQAPQPMAVPGAGGRAAATVETAGPPQPSGRSRALVVAGLIAASATVAGIAAGTAVLASQGGTTRDQAAGGASPAAPSAGPAGSTAPVAGPSPRGSASPAAKPKAHKTPAATDTPTHGPVPASWACGPADTLSTGEILRGCIRYDGSHVYLKGTLSGVSAPHEEIHLALKDSAQTDVPGMQPIGPDCTPGRTCVFQAVFQPPHGRYTLLPGRRVNRQWQSVGASDGRETPIITF
jgi:serine/threonine protein kinase, bacterial